MNTAWPIGRTNCSANYLEKTRFEVKIGVHNLTWQSPPPFARREKIAQCSALVRTGPRGLLELARVRPLGASSPDRRAKDEKRRTDTLGHGAPRRTPTAVASWVTALGGGTGYTINDHFSLLPSSCSVKNHSPQIRLVIHPKGLKRSVTRLCGLRPA